ncbi:MAG: hypothetical protein BWY09_01233 [Candidatus Hydrogenedentes bacterium ADurb.Bin179]|nr:MAG: hypothetical protein BWY09_01233 [Candidatus Hydrogenedentes bacterium ADurb.Bin179]
MQQVVIGPYQFEKTRFKVQQRLVAAVRPRNRHAVRRRKRVAEVNPRGKNSGILADSIFLRRVCRRKPGCIDHHPSKQQDKNRKDMYSFHFKFPFSTIVL